MTRSPSPRVATDVLLLDLGNTNFKWARMAGGSLGPVQSASHRHMPHDALLDACWGRDPAPGRLLVANVAGPEFTDALSRWAEGRWGLTPELVRSAPVLLGVRNGYRDPARLGVDRLLAMAAAHRRLGRAVCVVDCGTAVTLDAVDGAGLHLGGLILPGFAMMRWAIEQGTAIPPFAESDALELLARDTATAVDSAPVYAVAALIDRVMARLESGGDGPALAVTGSGAARLVRVLERDFEPMEHLVIEGLSLLAGDASGS